MVQISKKRLDKDIETEMYKQFWKSLSEMKNPQESSEFFSDILTETEKVMLAKRFAVALLVVRERTATEIRQAINVTYSTIATVSSWVKNAKPKTQAILKSLSSQKDWEVIDDRIEELIDKLPPRYHSDWSKTGRNKWERAKKRSSRRTLR